MGTWGEGPFENDEALDVLTAIQQLINTKGYSPQQAVLEVMGTPIVTSTDRLANSLRALYAYLLIQT